MTDKYLRVLELMKQRGGRIDVSDPALIAVLAEPPVAKVSLYMSEIRRLAGLEVLIIRGPKRAAVAYTLIAANPGGADDVKWQTSKYFGHTTRSTLAATT